MTKLLFILLTLSMLLSACTSTPDPITPQSGLIQSNLKRETNPQVDPAFLEELAAGNTQFAFDFYHQVNQGDENLIFSPLSLSLALGMTLSGARGTTREEMLQALALENLEDAMHPAFNALLQSIAASQAVKMAHHDGETFELNIANSIWGQAGADFEQDFLDGLAVNYGAGIYAVDYARDVAAARKEINDWIKQQTAGKIPSMIPDTVLDAATRLVLANAIYFKGSWAFPFIEGATKAAPFTTLDGAQVDVDMMYLAGETFHYAQLDGFKLVELPYLSQDFSMLIIVPDAGAFSEVEQNLSAESFLAAMDTMQTTPINLSMPKFDFETSIDAVPPLQALGMQAAFADADFSGISKTMALFISDVLHKATITVDEHGTEAAAATVVVMKESMAPAEPEQLVIDRPFMFAIMHQPSSTILFMGRVLQP